MVSADTVLSLFATAVSEVTSHSRTGLFVCRVVDAIQDDHFWKIKRAHAVNNGYVDPKLGRVRASLVVRIDAANRTKVMPSRFCVELI